MFLQQFKSSIVVFLAVFFPLFSGLEAHCREKCREHLPVEESTQKIGRHLVTQFWNKVVRQDVEGYASELACTFQGINIHGIYNRRDQIEGLSQLTVDSFELVNLKTNRHHHTLVITYDFVAQGEGIVSGPSLDVWQRTHDGWKQISHSYVPFE